MSTKTEKIVSKAVEVIKALPEGIRYSELVRTIQQDLPDMFYVNRYMKLVENELFL